MDQAIGIAYTIFKIATITFAWLLAADHISETTGKTHRARALAYVGMTLGSALVLAAALKFSGDPSYVVHTSFATVILALLLGLIYAFFWLEWSWPNILGEKIRAGLRHKWVAPAGAALLVAEFVKQVIEALH